MNPSSAPVVLGDDDPRVLGREPLEPLHDVARAGRVALVGEQRRDRFGVAGPAGRSVMVGLVGHGAMVPARRRSGTGAVRGPGRRATRRSGPNGPAPGRPASPAGASDPAYQATAGPSPCRARDAGQATLGVGLEDGQGHRRRAAPLPRQAARAEERPTRGVDERVARRRRGRPRARRGPLEVDRRPAERDEPGIRRGPARRPAASSRAASIRSSGAGHQIRTVRGRARRPREPGSLVQADRAGVVGEDPEMDPFAARGDAVDRCRSPSPGRPRPRPRAQSAVPIEDR